MLRATLVLAAATTLLSLVPAQAQYDDDDDDGPGLVYGGGYPPPAYVPYGPEGYGRYDPRRETYVGPYGRAHTRCRPHKACYESDD